MRIIAGTHKGRHLTAPPENIARPTTDRVREAMFSSLESMRGGLDGAVVLDVFSGSGALALEAISRGASFACMIEKSRVAFKTIEENIRSLGMDRNRVKLLSADSFKAAPMPPGGDKFDIIFLDPPYAVEPEEVVALMERLERSGSVAEDAIFMYEHDNCVSASADEAYIESDFKLDKRRDYGRVVIDTLKQDICANI